MSTQSKRNLHEIILEWINMERCGVFSLLASVDIDTASDLEGDLRNDWLYGSPVRVMSVPWCMQQNSSYWGHVLYLFYYLLSPLK